MPEDPAAEGNTSAQEVEGASGSNQSGAGSSRDPYTPSDSDVPGHSKKRRFVVGIATLIGRLIFGGLFFYAGLLKVKDPLSFLESVRGFQLVGDPWAAWVAMGLPWLEIFCGACVLTGVLYRGALAILCGAVCAFIYGIARAWSIGLDINCGCFGQTTPTTDYRTEIIQRAIFLAIGLVLFASAWLQVRANRASTENTAS